MKSIRESKVINFQGQEFFIGIDVHKNNWRVTIRFNHMELKTFSQNPSPEDLYHYMNKNYPGGCYYSVYEAGFCGFWIDRELNRMGFNNIIVNPADIPTKHKEKDQKRDPVDSRKLARELENGSLEGIYIPTKEQQSLRSLSRLYYQTIKKRIQIKNRIKSYLHYHGIKIPLHSDIKHWSGAFMQWLKTIKMDKDNDQYYLDRQIKNLEYHRKETLELLKRIKAYSIHNLIIQCIQSIPGIGILTAFIIYAELMEMRRFKNLDKLASMVGLIPSVSCSDEKEKNYGITMRYSKYIRCLLIESSWISIRKDPVLTLKFNEYIKRMSKQKAIIKIAKKLLSRIRYVWLNQQKYVLSVVE